MGGLGVVRLASVNGIAGILEDRCWERRWDMACSESLPLPLGYPKGKGVPPEFGPGSSLKGFESEFEEIIAQAIKSLGYIAVPQVGARGYRIDLGVIDPNIPGRYLLAVECNGGGHPTDSESEEKDRIRQKRIMEGKGWVFHTICEVNWKISKDEEREKLRKAIEAQRQRILCEMQGFKAKEKN